MAGKQVTVRLDPSQASHAGAARPGQRDARRRNIGDTDDPGGQNRFTALRRFQIWTCEAKANVDCAERATSRSIFTSPADAFPSGIPRPRAPELIIRSFDVPQTKATHVRLVVLNNQCTGAPEYQGDQDDDPNNSTDCDETTLAGLTGNGERVRIAELQVFSR